MSFRKLAAFVSGLVMVSASGAEAATRFGIAGVGNFANQVMAPAAVTYTKKLGIGGGAFVEFGLGKAIGLELGAFYVQRKHESSGLDMSFPHVQIPLIFRYWLGEAVSIGVGGYYAIGVGNATSSAAAGGGGSVSTSFATLFTKTSDYGLAGSLAFNLPLGKSLGLLVEGRYLMGLVDVFQPTTAGTTSKWNDIQALVGLRFGGSK